MDDAKSSNEPDWKQQGPDTPCSNNNRKRKHPRLMMTTMDRRNVNTVKDTGNHDNTCRDLKLEGSSDKNVSRRSITNAFDDEKDDSVRISCKKQRARLKDPAVYNICKQENEKASGSEWQASTTDTTKNGVSKEDYDAKISTRLQLYEYQFEPPPSPPELMSLTRHTKDAASQQQNELELPPQITSVTSNLQGRKSNTTSMDMDAAIAVPWQKEEPKTSAASFSQIITSPSRGASRNSEGRTRTIPGTYTDAAIAAPWQKEELNASAATFPRISSPSRGARSYINTSFDWEVLMQLPIDNEQEDTLLATILQATVKAKQEESEEKDRICMLSTRCGRACLFVQKVVAVTNELLGNVASNHYLVPEQNHSQIKAIANDDMIVHVERLLARQDDFRESNKPILVDIGYHYTNQRNIESIKTKSLVTRQELLEQGIHSRSSRVAFFGDGIYTANNPFAFHRDGAEGLLVARIQGATRRAVQAQRLVRRDGSFDTIIGNKAKSYTPASRVDLYDEVVLLNSSQCLPLVQYSSRIIRRNPRVTGADTDSPIRIFHIAMQQIVDEFFNEGKSTSDWTAVKLPPAASVNSDPMVSQSQDPFSGKSWYTPNGQLRSAGVASGQASSPNQGSAPMAATQVSSKRLCSRRSSVSGAARIALSSTSNTMVGNTGAHSNTSPSRLPTTRPPIKSFMASLRSTSDAHRQHVYRYNAPDSMGNVTDLKVMSIPSFDSVDTGECCSVCLDPLLDAKLALDVPYCVSLNICSHKFHRGCILQVLERSRACPLCRKLVSRPQGQSPSGLMKVTFLRNRQIDDFSDIVMEYCFPAGVQKAYHDNPGARYHGTVRRAFLPDSPEGKHLLRRLIFAFRCGLTFRVGTSLTNGRPDSITWASIHHKTSLTGGVHGFPDPGYFRNANEELDNLGVPKDCSDVKITES